MSLSARIEKLELLRMTADVPMVASQTGTGFYWNGQTFPDEAAFDTALLMSGASGKLIVLNEG